MLSRLLTAFVLPAGREPVLILLGALVAVAVLIAVVLSRSRALAVGLVLAAGLLVAAIVILAAGGGFVLARAREPVFGSLVRVD